MTNKMIKSLIMPSAVLVALLAAGTNTVFAEDECEPIYGGGEICNKSFKVSKEVTLDEDANDGDDKVTDVDKDETIYFIVEITNKGDITVDNMKMKDKLPDELERIGGDGLTEEWDDFEPGEKVEFRIKAKIKDSEFDRDNFEKCVVNKAEVYYDGEFEGADTATVCYEKGEITELPKTGADAGIFGTIAGLGLATLGTITSLIKRKTA